LQIIENQQVINENSKTEHFLFPESCRILLTQSGIFNLKHFLSEVLCHVFQFLHGFSDAAASVPVFACTPDLFPELMAAAISKRDLKQWAGEGEVVLKG
jgi:hypothetical protein